MELHAFTTYYDSRKIVLTNEVQVTSDHSPNFAFKPYTAIWDTGAEATCISPKIVSECALKPIGVVQAQGPYGAKLAKVYPLRIRLPNDIGLKLKAIEANNLDPDGDVLVGMDVITLGDFAVSTYEGRTVFTFRMPSQGRIDFLPPEQRHLRSC